MKALAFLLALGASAGAAPEHVVRMATLAPEGTAYARELKAFGREVAASTGGGLEVKFYMGSIAGDELQALARVRRGQLDGIASAGMLCQRLAPTLRVIRVAGLFHDRDEVDFLLNYFKDRVAQEAGAAGFTLLGLTDLGPEMVFLRKPVASLDELRRVRLFRWDLDDVGLALSRDLGLQGIPIAIEQGARAFDEGKIDGFIAIPGGLLAFQWYSRVRYLIEVPLSYLSGCLLVDRRAYERLSRDQQLALDAAGAKLSVRLGEATRQMDEQLLGPLFLQHGHKLPAARFARELAPAFQAARARLTGRVVPAALVDQAERALDGYRAQHRR